jgi:hypothetical protein
MTSMSAGLEVPSKCRLQASGVIVASDLALPTAGV